MRTFEFKTYQDRPFSKMKFFTLIHLNDINQLFTAVHIRELATIVLFLDTL